jgi:hypothetical protein
MPIDRDHPLPSLSCRRSLGSRSRERRNLKPGTVLVRDHAGRRHTVTVVRDGFVWEGNTYSSLSAIARAITGTAWSGPRFFGTKVSESGGRSTPSPGQAGVRVRRSAQQPKQPPSSTAARPASPL